LEDDKFRQHQALKHDFGRLGRLDLPVGEPKEIFVAGDMLPNPEQVS
jgi:hypothetical protein